MNVSVLSASKKVSLREALIGCGVSDEMEKMVPQPGPRVLCNSTPTCSTFAGKLGSLLRVDFASGPEPVVGVNLVLDLDNAIVRRRGGCYYHDTMNITLCLPGKVGLYKFNTAAQSWEKDALVHPWEEGEPFWSIDRHEDGFIDLDELQAALKFTSNFNASRDFDDPFHFIFDDITVRDLSDLFERADFDGDLVIDRDEYKSLSSQVFRTNVKSSSTWAALATPRCCDYEGTGAACGDKIFRRPRMNDGSESKVEILLGGGVFSGKPKFSLTDRPAFKSMDDVVTARDLGSKPKPMKLRSGWRQLCTSQIGDQQLPSCEGNVASLDWCADITHENLNECIFFMCASLDD
jgi:hypothetical protein